MKRELIDFDDIRVGDTVERVGYGITSRINVASRTGVLVRNENGGYLYVQDEAPASWFLIDRPKPPVVLPTEPTLGWATYTRRVGSVGQPEGATLLGEWSTPDPRLGSSVCLNGGTCGVLEDWITAFIPATAVPTEALDELRDAIEQWRRKGNFRVTRVTRFLAAVDEAQS